MKNIVVFTHAGGSPLHGPNTRWYFLGTVLQSRGYRVNIVSCSFFHKYRKLPQIRYLFKQELISGVLYHWIRSTPYTGRGVLQVLNQLIYTFLSLLYIPFLCRLNISCVVASSPHPFAYIPAFILSFLTKSKLIYEVRDLWPTVLNQLNVISPSHPYSLFLKATERFAVQTSSIVVSVKQNEYQYFHSSYGLPKSRHKCVPNGFRHINH